MALLQTLTDPFNNTSLNGTLWAAFTAGSATLTYSSAGASCNFPATSSSSTDGDINSKTGYNLTGSYAVMNVTSVLSGSNNDCNLSLWAANSSNNALQFQVEAGTLYAQKIISGAQTNLHSATFSLTTHAWWRIRESGGTIYWDTSTDGITWTNFTSVANLITITNIYVDIGGVSFGADTSAGHFIWKNFNVLPGSVNNGAAFLTMLGA